MTLGWTKARWARLGEESARESNRGGSFPLVGGKSESSSCATASRFTALRPEVLTIPLGQLACQCGCPCVSGATLTATLDQFATDGKQARSRSDSAHAMSQAAGSTAMCSKRWVYAVWAWVLVLFGSRQSASNLHCSGSWHSERACGVESQSRITDLLQTASTACRQLQEGDFGNRFFSTLPPLSPDEPPSRFPSPISYHCFGCAGYTAYTRKSGASTNSIRFFPSQRFSRQTGSFCFGGPWQLEGGSSA